MAKGKWRKRRAAKKQARISKRANKKLAKEQRKNEKKQLRANRKNERIAQRQAKAINRQNKRAERKIARAQARAEGKRSKFEAKSKKERFDFGGIVDSASGMVSSLVGGNDSSIIDTLDTSFDDGSNMNPFSKSIDLPLEEEILPQDDPNGYINKNGVFVKYNMLDKALLKIGLLKDNA